MSYDVYWVKNRAEKIADFEHPTLRGTLMGEMGELTYPQLRCFAACSGFHDIGPAPRNPQLILNLFAFVGAWLRRDAIASYVCIRFACEGCNT